MSQNNAATDSKQSGFSFPWWDIRCLKGKLFYTAVSLAVYLLGASALYWNMAHQMAEGDRKLAHYYQPVVNNINAILNGIDHSSAAQRAHIISGRSVYSNERGEMWPTQIEPATDKLQNLLEKRGQEEELQKIRRLQVALKDYKQVQEKVDRMVRNFQERAQNENPSAKAKQEFDNKVLSTLAAEIRPTKTRILKLLHPLQEDYEDRTQQAIAQNLEKEAQAAWLFWGSGFVFLTLLIGVSMHLYRWSMQQVNNSASLIRCLARGDLPEDYHTGRSELGPLVQSGNYLKRHLQEAANFAGAVGEGQFDKAFQPASESDQLGKSLLDMRDRLQKVSSEDSIRRWINEGVAKYSDVLRTQGSSVEEMAQQVISGLVEDTGAVQGGIYLTEDRSEQAEDNQDHTVLDLKAAYAYHRRKYVEKQVMPGEGLVGQVYLEQQSKKYVKVPPDYLVIDSGFGNTQPAQVLAVPMLSNGQVSGVIELATLQEFQDYHIELLEKLAESMASTVSALRVNERTKQLLEESQMQAEQMQAQEEEMRQNNEELQATQEEMERQQNEVQQMKDSLEEMTSNLPGMIYQFRMDTKTGKGNYEYVSEKSAALFGIAPETFKNHEHSPLQLHPEDKTHFAEKELEAARKGESYFATVRIKAASGEYEWFQLSATPIAAGEGEVLWNGYLQKSQKTATAEA